MLVRTWLLVALLALALAGVAACNSTESGSSTGGGAITEGQPEAGAVQPGGEAAEPDQPVAMIASGSATVPPRPEATEQVRPQPVEGVQRVSTIEEARAKVPFTLLEPQVLPENTSLTIVQLIEAVEGETAPDLPAVRLIYDVDTEGVLVLKESPATGEPFEGEAVTIGSASGGIQEMEAATILTWESDGVRFEMRGANGVGRDTLMAAAESLAPGAPAGESE